MMPVTHEVQKLLVAVNESGSMTLLAARGDAAKRAVAEYGHDFEDLNFGETLDDPSSLGLYVWEGTLTEEVDEDIDPVTGESDYLPWAWSRGNWREVTCLDCELFDMPLPIGAINEDDIRGMI